MGKSWARKRKLDSELNSEGCTPEQRKALEEERITLLQKLRRKTLRNKRNRKIRLQTAEQLLQQQKLMLERLVVVITLVLKFPIISNIIVIILLYSPPVAVSSNVYNRSGNDFITPPLAEQNFESSR